MDIAVDVQQVLYSGVASVGNPLLPNLMQSPLGTDGGAGFGWEDMTTIKGGVQLRAGEGWTWRAGYSYGSQPIPESEVLFNILAPGVDRAAPDRRRLEAGQRHAGDQLRGHARLLARR